MFELQDLKGLLMPEIFKKLEQQTDGQENYSLISDEVDQVVKSNTNYTSDLLEDADNEPVRDQLRRPYSWILEYYALKFIKTVPENQQKIIVKNYEDALEMLATFERYYADTPTEDSSNTIDIDGVVKW